MLIPGRYDMEDFLQDTSKRPLTYGFKAVEREQGPKIGQGCLDKVCLFVCVCVCVCVCVLELCF